MIQVWLWFSQNTKASSDRGMAVIIAQVDPRTKNSVRRAKGSGSRRDRQFDKTLDVDTMKVEVNVTIPENACSNEEAVPTMYIDEAEKKMNQAVAQNLVSRRLIVQKNSEISEISEISFTDHKLTLIYSP
jgi:hypothetical protein